MIMPKLRIAQSIENFVDKKEINLLVNYTDLILLTDSTQKSMVVSFKDLGYDLSLPIVDLENFSSADDYFLNCPKGFDINSTSEKSYRDEVSIVTLKMILH